MSQCFRTYFTVYTKYITEN